LIGRRVDELADWLTSLIFSFGLFFNQIDHYPGDDFLYVTSGGIRVARPARPPKSAEDRAAEIEASNAAVGAAASETTDTQEQTREDKSRIQALAAVESDPEEDRLIDGGEEGG
jgi:hypothetical protein